MGPALPARIRETLDRICSSGWGILEDGPSSAGPIEPILEQPDRTGSPASETADSADAGVQTIRQRGNHH